MNIFIVDKDPILAAQALVDRHVVKMIIETAQLLSTAHRVIDGTKVVYKNTKGCKATRYDLAGMRGNLLYKATHVNHPCAIWVRSSKEAYMWTYMHFLQLLKEYTYRYNKTHATARLSGILDYIPEGLCDYNNYNVEYNSAVSSVVYNAHIIAKDAPLAMPDEYKTSDTIESYRNYYREGKKHLHKYTKRNPPEWLHPLIIKSEHPK